MDTVVRETPSSAAREANVAGRLEFVDRTMQEP